MKNIVSARVRTGLRDSSAMACAILVCSAAEARCVDTGTSVVCDASAPNPETNGAIGSQIRVLPGAVVQLDDPFAGASVRFSTIDVFGAGTLTTSDGSQIYDVVNGGTAVNTGGGVTIDHAGTITARQANARGVLLGQNGILAIAQRGVIETLASGSTFAFQSASAAVAIGGTGTTTLVDGTVRSFGDNAPAITTSASGLFGPTTSPAIITVGASGNVSTVGSNSTAIAVGGGSTLTVGGSVAATGAGSSAITYQAGTGDVTIGILAGSTVNAAQAAAITGTGADVALYIGGTVSSGTTAAIELGSGADQITLQTGARVTGLIDSGAGTDALTLIGNGAGAIGSTAGFETLTVAGGSWTVSGTQVYDGGTTIASGATEIGTGSVLNGSFANAGTLQFDQATDSSFVGTITGAGQVVKSGTGTLTIGAQGYGGATNVTAGTLALTGNLASGSYAIASGAILTSGMAATIMTAEPLTITNAGTIRATNGRAIVSVGDFADTITNISTITGGSVGAIDLGGGDDTLNLLSGSIITGAVDGGVGNDRINLGGAGSGSFAGAVNFETLAVNSGSWTLTAPSTFANGIAIAAPATLIGNATTLTGSIGDAGTLVFDQASDGRVAATLTGAGQLTKIGAGTLTIANQTGFTGRTIVGAGQLLLAGTLPSVVTVASGGTLAGSGTVAGIAVATGGTISPGQAGIGTITVTGGFSQAAGSTYAAQTGTASLSDRIVVGGAATIGNGALLSVTRDAAAGAAIGTRYTLLTATGGIAGTYTLVQTPTGGTELRLTQTGNAVFVDVARSGSGLAGLAATRNQAAVVGALAALGRTNAAYAALVVNPDDAAVRSGLGLLSGEAHATLRTAMLKTAQGVQDAVRARLLAPAIGTGVALWAQGMGQSGADDGGRGTASAQRHGWGAVGGIDVAIGEVGRVGVAVGYTRTTLSIDGRESAATLKDKHALVYAGTTAGPIAIRSSLGYAWVDNAMRRNVTFTGYAATLASRYDGNVIHGQVELGLPHPMMGGIVEPFAGVEYYRVETDGFSETGGDTALTADKQHEAFSIATLGIRGQTPIVDGLSARSRIGWQHALDRVYPQSTVRFVSGSVPFSVIGAPLSRDAAAVALDLAWTPNERLTITSGYSGIVGGRSDDSIFRIIGSLAF